MPIIQKNRFWYALVVLIIIAFILVILGFQKWKPQRTTDNSINGITNDIKRHASSILTIQSLSSNKSYWITQDGYMVAVNDQSNLISSFKGTVNTAEAEAVRELASYSLRRLADAGYKPDQDNSSTSTDNKPFYMVRSAFISPDGISRCMIEPPDESSPIWFFQCINSQDINDALQESLPFLRALGDIKGIAVIPAQQQNNFATVNVTDGQGGYYAIMKKAGNEWKVIYRGQDSPSCVLMNQYGVPQSIYDKCL